MGNVKKLSILLIEDSGMFISIAEEMLAAHNVEATRTAADGIKKYKELPGGTIMLYSSNENYEPIIVPRSEIEVIFRIVGVWKEI